MIIADTWVWIEFLKGREPLFAEFRGLLESQEILAVESVFGELLQGAKSIRERNLIEGYWRHLPKMEEAGIWLEAGRFSGEKNLASRGVGLIDSVLIVASRRAGVRLWTLDKKLQECLEQLSL